MNKIGTAALTTAFILVGAIHAHAFQAGGLSVSGGSMTAGAPVAGSMSGMSARSIGGGLPVNSAGPMSPIRVMPQRFREMTVVGQVGVDPAKLPSSATIIRLRLDGREIPMRLDTEMHGAAIQFDPHAGYASELYRSVLSKQVEVVGEQALRDDIADAADHSKSMRIEGYVFDPASPYFVVKSAQADNQRE
jgi:hypothetical protein